MGFGIPCDTPPDPSSAYTTTEEVQATLTDVCQQLLTSIDQQGQQCCGNINEAVAPIIQFVQRVITNNTRVLNDIFRLLTMEITSQDAAITIGLSSIIDEIAALLQITTQDVIHGPYPQPATPSPFPPSTLPYPPPAPAPMAPGYPPGTAPAIPIVPGQPVTLPLPPSLVGPTGQPISPLPQYPPWYTNPAPLPPFGPGQPQTPILPGGNVTIVFIDGNPVAVSQVCPTIPAGPTVIVGGNEYAPTVSVVQNGGSLSIGPTGSPIFNISYDVQPDGSIAVHVGPVSVVINATPTTTNPDAPACQLVPQ